MINHTLWYRFICWLCRKSLNILEPIDTTLREGDEVTSPNWHLTPLYIVSINWALHAAAVKLGPDGGIVVWGLWNLKKVSTPGWNDDPR